MKQIIGGYRLFFLDLLHRLSELHIDVKGMPISHLCYRVRTLSEYKLRRDQIKPFCKSISESDFNGRPVSMLLLKTPLRLAESYSTSLIELPAPKISHEYTAGIEHCGFVVKNFSQFKKKYGSLLTGQKDHGPNCKPLFLTFENGKTAKFYDITLKEVVLLDGWKFKAL